MKKLGLDRCGGFCLHAVTLKGVMDLSVDKLARYTWTKTGRKGSNAARDFHRHMRNENKTLLVDITVEPIPVRHRTYGKHGKRVFSEKMVQHPVLHLASWMQCVLRLFPKFVLGGHDLHSDTGVGQSYTDMFRGFWSKFHSLFPCHPIYSSKTVEEQGYCIPYACHGDEGRGLARDPLLVLSFQLLIPYTGDKCLNLTQHLAGTQSNPVAL